jgi:glyoxylase-like metal-dependent hydrolase (beta-lactamase superfamily II)
MKISVLNTGEFKLDGGAMFGIVPKSMWQKLNPPDEQNLCTWVMRTLLIESEDKKILIDTGIGNKQDDKFRAHFHPSKTTILDALDAQNIDAASITDVFLTHLHFDHVGGACHIDNQQNIATSFREATYWSNTAQWQWAIDANMKEKASFLQENFLPIQKNNQLQFIDIQQDVKLFDNFNIFFTYGHTEAMMMPKITIGDKTVIFCADSMPASYHVPMPYVMSYDIRPMDTLKEKEWLLSEAAANGWILFFEHDPYLEAATIKKDEKGRYIIDKSGKLADFITN